MVNTMDTEIKKAEELIAFLKDVDDPVSEHEITLEDMIARMKKYDEALKKRGI